MADRPNSYDVQFPRGSSSVRITDDELRKIKRYQLNAWNDMVNTDRSAAGRETHPLYMTNMSATGNATIGGTASFTGLITATGGMDGAVGVNNRNSGNFTTLDASGVVTIGDYTITVDTSADHVTIATGGTNLFRINGSDGSVLAAGNVTAHATIS